ncbi:MAG: hypothetical protein COA77_10755 [Thaumarchaeota archaeon]|nr:MAG: hypothetical protein COA77_10755 [Nitrososphaerota archaeon]
MKLLSIQVLMSDSNGILYRPRIFLAFTLVLTEGLLGMWLYKISEGDHYDERVIVGSLMITALIAVLVVYCIVYLVQRRYDHFDSHK